MSDLARSIGLNEKTLTLGFRTRYGMPVYRFLQAERLKHARLLLEQGENVTEVSLRVGYTNPSHFAYLFKREYGMSPSQTRS